MKKFTRKKPGSNKQSVKKSLLKISLITFLGAIVVAGLILAYFKQKPLTSPISQLSQFKFINTYVPPKNKEPKIIYGFLPYWNLNRVQLNPKLTHVAYFRLAINDDGEVMVNNEGEAEMGYKRLQSERFLDIINQLEKNQTQLDIVFTIFNADTASQFLNSNEAKANFFKNLDSVLLAYPIKGVNLDVEVNASAGAKLKPQFTQFVTETKAHLDQKPEKIQLSIDVYPSAASGKHIWDLPALGKVSDFIILMAYDFHRRGSTQAGPVAPLFGGGDIFASDIHGYLKDTVKQVPAKKILLGIPFYGYQWQTVDHSSQSKTYPNTGKTLFYSQVIELLNQPDVKRNWNSKALSPYLTFTKDDKNYLVYYDDKNSLHYKLELVNKLDLGGIAIWALGYEGGTQELWQEIIKNLSN